VTRKDRRVDRVEVETLKVGQGGGRDLLADLYRPPNPNGSGVLLIYAARSWKGPATARRLRHRARSCGLHLTRVRVPTRRRALWPAGLDDVHTAFGFFHAEAKSLARHVETAVSGNSAGGCLSLLLAGTSALRVAASIAFYAPVDFLGADARSKGSPRA